MINDLFQVLRRAQWVGSSFVVYLQSVASQKINEMTNFQYKLDRKSEYSTTLDGIVGERVRRRKFLMVYCHSSIEELFRIEIVLYLDGTLEELFRLDIESMIDS